MENQTDTNQEQVEPTKVELCEYCYCEPVTMHAVINTRRGDFERGFCCKQHAAFSQMSAEG